MVAMAEILFHLSMASKAVSVSYFLICVIWSDTQTQTGSSQKSELYQEDSTRKIITYCADNYCVWICMYMSV